MIIICITLSIKYNIFNEDRKDRSNYERLRKKMIVFTKETILTIMKTSIWNLNYENYLREITKENQAIIYSEHIYFA